AADEGGGNGKWQMADGREGSTGPRNAGSWPQDGTKGHKAGINRGGAKGAEWRGQRGSGGGRLVRIFSSVLHFTLYGRTNRVRARTNRVRAKKIPRRAPFAVIPLLLTAISPVSASSNRARLVTTTKLQGATGDRN